MASRRIAPTLAWWLSAYGNDSDLMKSKAAAELRALLAVARAAKAYKNREGIVYFKFGERLPEGDRLIRALDRLSRVSRPRGAPRGKR